MRLGLHGHWEVVLFRRLLRTFPRRRRIVTIRVATGRALARGLGRLTSRGRLGRCVRSRPYLSGRGTKTHRGTVWAVAHHRQVCALIEGVRCGDWAAAGRWGRDRRRRCDFGRGGQEAVLVLVCRHGCIEKRVGGRAALGGGGINGHLVGFVHGQAVCR